MGKKDDVQNEKKIDDQAQEVSVQEFENLKAEFDLVKDLSAQMEGQLKRALADYQNLEKRVAEGRSELASWATADFIKRLLPVVSQFDQVIAGVKDEERNTGWFKGVELTVKQLQEVLKGEGLDEIEADGQFDPSLHEAVDTQDGEDGKILKIAEKGYKLNGKVVKPAKVVVGRKGN